jgi:molecular chaperone HscB
MTTPSCWSCGAACAPESLLCPACGKVQPVPPLRPGEPSVVDKFALLAVPRAFDQDGSLLEERFRATSRKLHPDRFVRASAPERRFALEQTTRLNDAYRTLKDPVRRAEHLLELHGVHLAGEHRRPHELPVQQVTMAPDFLEQMMEDREQLMEAKLSGDQAALARLGAAMREKRDTTLQAVAAMLRTLDGPAADRCAPEKAAEQLARLRYYARYLDELEGRPAEP